MTRLEELLDLYFETFGKNYPIMITSEKSDEEIIADIKRCIENDEPAKEFTYEDENIY